MEYFIMTRGDRIEGRVSRENDTEVRVEMANGSAANLPKNEILERGQLEERGNRER